MTDIHYNSTDQNLEFNWRMIYPEIYTPLNTLILQISLFHAATIGSGKLLGEVSFNMFN